MTPKNTLPAKAQKQLEKLRMMVDRADLELLMALYKRGNAVAKVGELKLEYNLPLAQPRRWKEVVRSRVNLGKELKINEKFLRSILGLIHDESLRIQKRGMK